MIALAAFAGLATWLASYLALGFALGLLSGPLPGLALVFRVQPYKAIAWVALQVVSLLAGWNVFIGLAK